MLYPGEVVASGDQGDYKVSVMQPAGPNWKWPNRRDNIFYVKEKLKVKLQPWSFQVCYKVLKDGQWIIRIEVLYDLKLYILFKHFAVNVIRVMKHTVGFNCSILIVVMDVNCVTLYLLLTF